MDELEFLKNFSKEFEITEPEEIEMNTVFRELDEWDSLLGLSIIGMIKNKYNVTITGSEIKDCKTVKDLFNLVNSRI